MPFITSTSNMLTARGFCVNKIRRTAAYRPMLTRHRCPAALEVCRSAYRFPRRRGVGEAVQPARPIRLIAQSDPPKAGRLPPQPRPDTSPLSSMGAPGIRPGGSDIIASRSSAPCSFSTSNQTARTAFRLLTKIQRNAVRAGCSAESEPRDRLAAYRYHPADRPLRYLTKR